MKKKFNKRIAGINGIILGCIAFLMLAPVGLAFAGVFAAGMAALPHLSIHLPTGILGDNAPVMTEAELLLKIKSKIEEGTIELKGKITELEKKNASFTEMQTKLTELETKGKDLKSLEDFKLLAKECSDLSLEVKALKDNGIEKKNMSRAEIIEKSLEKQKDEIKLIASKGGRVKLDYKAAAAISSANFGAGVLQGLRLPGIDPLDRNAQTILPEITIINGGPGSDPFSWVEKVIGEGGAAPTAESANKPLYDWDYVENKVTAEMVAAVVVVTKQALLRMPMLMSHINEELIAELKETLQTQIITGSGVSPQLNGILLNATAFNPPIQQTTQAANNYDVIAAIASQVVLAHGMPTAIGVSPSMFYELQTTKDANNQYLLPPFMQGMPSANTQGSGLIIAGMRVFPMWDLTADQFVGGDLRRYMFNIVEDINIEIGYFNDIWLKNQLAVRAEIFGNGGVKNQHKNKIIKGTFTYAKALLDGAVSS